MTIEQKLKDALGEHFKAWHLKEVERIIKTTTFTEDETVKAVVKKIRKTKGLR